MTAIHFLQGINRAAWKIVMHFPMPDTNNAAGVNFRTALIASGIGRQPDGRLTILPAGDGLGGTISASEEAQLDAGALFEYVGVFRAERGGTSDVQRQASARAFFASEGTRRQEDMVIALRYFGHTESEG